MKWLKFAMVMALLLAVIGTASAGSISLSLNSLEAITEGDTVTLTATVTASGDSVSGVSLELGALPAGTSTSDSLVQSVGTLSSGQSSSKSWTIIGDVAGNYTFNVTASGTGVSSDFKNASLVVNTAGYIQISEKTCSATSLAAGGAMTMSFIVSNTGGSSATVSINMANSGLTLSSGSASTSFALSAGAQSTRSYSFTAGSSAGGKTITAAVTSTANDPIDQTCAVTITGATAVVTPTTGSAGTSTAACTSDANCNDDNPCTTDSCTSNLCVYANVANGDYCGAGKICSDGDCVAQSAPAGGTGTPGIGGENKGAVGGNVSGTGTPSGAGEQKWGGLIPINSTTSIITLAVLALILLGAIYYLRHVKKGKKNRLSK